MEYVKFAIGNYRITDDETRAEDIRIIKITPSRVVIHIVEYHGSNYSLHDKTISRKIFTNNTDGNEYINTIYYYGNEIFNPSSQQLDSDSGFDCLFLRANELKLVV
jgi:hypothetical protein